MSAIEQRFDFIGGRVLLNFVEDLASFVFRQHSAYWLSALKPSAPALVSLVCRTHFDVPESRRRRTVARPHDLLGLSLSAIGCAPECPFVALANCIHGIPEVGRDSRIRP